jgi:hypothetical protein
MQDNRYWSSQNPHLTHEVMLRSVKVGIWHAASARIVGPAFNETVSCKKYLCVEGQHF